MAIFITILSGLILLDIKNLRKGYDGLFGAVNVFCAVLLVNHLAMGFVGCWEVRERSKRRREERERGERR